MLSQRAASRKVWQASQFEFEDVVAEVDDALVVSPGAGRSRLSLAGRRAADLTRVALGRPRGSEMLPVTDLPSTDVLFAVFSSAQELRHLEALRDSRARYGVRIAFVIELWQSQIPAAERYLRLLRGFDHVYVFSRWVIPDIERITGASCSYLPTGIDLDRFCPEPGAPERVIDVYNYGRGLAETDRALVEAMERGELFYLAPTVAGPFSVVDPRVHRTITAATLKRARYSVVYRNNDNESRRRLTGGEESLSNRHFEAITAGTVVLGTPPEVSDFDDCFPWEDAVVPIAAPEPRIADVIAELDAAPDRLQAIARRNVGESLRRHDWAHRWRTVLAHAGLPETERLTARLQRLDAAADRFSIPA